jgi:hypothetical protein
MCVELEQPPYGFVQVQGPLTFLPRHLSKQ